VPTGTVDLVTTIVGPLIVAVISSVAAIT